MISVVTITYNNYGELIKTLDSIDGIPNIERIVVNGGTCPKTKSFLQNKFSGVFVSEPDRGIADAFNKGILISKGDAILFLNSGDALLDREYLYEADSMFQKMLEIDFIHSNIIFDDQLIGKTEFKPGTWKLGRGMPYFHQTMIVRRRVFQSIGVFDLKYKIAMDYDFVVRMYRHKLNNGHYVNRATVLMDGCGISSTNEKDSIEQCYNSLKENHMLTFDNWLAFYNRVFFFKIRFFLNKFELKPLLIFLKKIKRNLF